MTKKRKPMIGLYCRVSTAEGKQKTTSQKLVIKSWLKQNRYRTGDYKWFEDKSSGKNLERPAITRLLKAVARGSINVVVIHDLTRLSRSVQDGLKTIQFLAGKECRLVSVTENLDIGGPMQTFVCTLMLAIGQLFRESQVEKIKNGIEARRRAGLPMGRPRNTKRLAKIRKMKNDGLSCIDISQKLKCSRANVYALLKRAG